MFDKSYLVMIIIFAKITKNHCTDDPLSIILDAVVSSQNVLRFHTVYRKIWAINRFSSLFADYTLIIFINDKTNNKFLLAPTLENSK